MEDGEENIESLLKKFNSGSKVGKVFKELLELDYIIDYKGTQLSAIGTKVIHIYADGEVIRAGLDDNQLEYFVARTNVDRFYRIKKSAE